MHMAFDGKLLAGVTVLMPVVEAGTIARAAAAFGLSPSGVSHLTWRCASANHPLDRLQTMRPH
jgi:hypothetical protein